MQTGNPTIRSAIRCALTALLIVALAPVAAAQTPTPTPVAVDGAGILSEGLSGFKLYNVPASLDFTVSYLNTGDSTWTAADGYRLGIEGGPITIEAILEAQPVPPGFSYQFHGHITPADSACDLVNLLCTYPCVGQMIGPGGPFGQQFQATMYVGGYPPAPTPTPSPSPTAQAGRDIGDFDNSGCTDLGDFLYLLDHWDTDVDGTIVGIADFLSLLDNWMLGAMCP